MYDLEKENEDLSIELIDSDFQRFTNGESIFSILSVCSFREGGSVKIVIKGEYPLEKLKNYANNIGRIFSQESTERSTYAIPHKMTYGHYPDEEQ